MKLPTSILNEKGYKMKVKIEIDLTPEEAKEMMTPAMPDYMNPAISTMVGEFQKAWWEQAQKMFSAQQKG
jgi:hypothetical protein